jgi:hypothetical protein
MAILNLPPIRAVAGGRKDQRRWRTEDYGLMLTARGFAGVFGPLLIAIIRQATGS